MKKHLFDIELKMDSKVTTYTANSISNRLVQAGYRGSILVTPSNTDNYTITVRIAHKATHETTAKSYLLSLLNKINTTSGTFSIGDCHYRNPDDTEELDSNGDVIESDGE